MSHVLMLARIVKETFKEYIQLLLKYQPLTSPLLIYDSGKYLHEQRELAIKLFIVTIYTLIIVLFLENGNLETEFGMETFQSKRNAITPTVTIQQNHFHFFRSIIAFLGHPQCKECLRNKKHHDSSDTTTRLSYHTAQMGLGFQPCII